MVKTIKEYSFPVSVGSAIGVILFIGLSVWNGATGFALSENTFNTKINNNTARIDAIEEKFETQQQYLYNLKSDLKSDIKSGDDKLDKIYNLLFIHVSGD